MLMVNSRARVDAHPAWASRAAPPPRQAVEGQAAKQRREWTSKTGDFGLNSKMPSKVVAKRSFRRACIRASSTDIRSTVDRLSHKAK